MKSVLLGLTIAAACGTAALAQMTIAQDETRPAVGAFTVGQIEDADVFDMSGKEVGEVEHVLLDAAGAPTAVVIEIDRIGPDKHIVVALGDLSFAPDPQDPGDLIARAKLNKDQLLALPDWSR